MIINEEKINIMNKKKMKKKVINNNLTILFLDIPHNLLINESPRLHKALWKQTKFEFSITDNNIHNN